MYRFKLSEIKNAIEVMELNSMFTDSDTLRDRIELAICDLKDFANISRSSDYMSCDRCDIIVHISDESLYYTKESGDGYHDPITETHYCRCGRELSNDITFNQYINYILN